MIQEKEPRYLQIKNTYKRNILKGKINPGDYLPSENELCKKYSITRTTARKALEDLQKEGYIERIHGKGSKVKERRQSLGLLNVKGFSEAAGNNVRTEFIVKPKNVVWPNSTIFSISEVESKNPCIHFKRLRFVGKAPVMVEENWFSQHGLKDFIDTPFIEGSFFKTLSQKYLIEIIGSEQELRAELANQNIASKLKIKEGTPILHISIKFITNKQDLNIYGELFCNTEKYPIGNQYIL